MKAKWEAENRAASELEVRDTEILTLRKKKEDFSEILTKTSNQLNI